MLLGALSATLLRNILTDKGVNRSKIPGQEAMKAGEGITRANQNFQLDSRWKWGNLGENSEKKKIKNENNFFFKFCPIQPLFSTTQDPKKWLNSYFLYAKLILILSQAKQLFIIC